MLAVKSVLTKSILNLFVQRQIFSARGDGWGGSGDWRGGKRPC